ncbi:hypothetical protein [Streptomyces sp. ISID311]|uniref:hypothetical protein n=1 Tax=Streptomyces sp. ISID311 TaxID=2601673 RepID=UPI001C9B81A2|nr:hypothetical protein [Streptomyces sp. ISID311]
MNSARKSPSPTAATSPAGSGTFTTPGATASPPPRPGLDFAAFRAAFRVTLPEAPSRRITYEDFPAAPEKRPLKTSNGRIEIFSRTIDSFGYGDCPGHPTWLHPDVLSMPLGEARTR